jgi:hypothetical protein
VRTLVIPSSVFSSIEDMIDASSDVFASANTFSNESRVEGLSAKLC